MYNVSSHILLFINNSSECRINTKISPRTTGTTLLRLLFHYLYIFKICRCRMTCSTIPLYLYTTRLSNLCQNYAYLKDWIKCPDALAYRTSQSLLFRAHSTILSDYMKRALNCALIYHSERAYCSSNQNATDTTVTVSVHVRLSGFVVQNHRTIKFSYECEKVTNVNVKKILVSKKIDQSFFATWFVFAARASIKLRPICRALRRHQNDQSPFKIS